MEVQPDYGKAFIPSSSKRNLLVLYIACAIFICMGLCLIFLGGYEMVPGGIAMTAFAVFILILGRFFTTRSGIGYFVSTKAIILKQGKTICSIPYEELESATLLKEGQGEELLVHLQNKLVEKQRGIMALNPDQDSASPPLGVLGSLKKVFTEQIRAHDKFRFLSVPITYIEGEPGVQRSPEKVNGADLPGETVFILLKSGESYMISPLDAQGFVDEAGKRIKS